MTESIDNTPTDNTPTPNYHIPFGFFPFLAGGTIGLSPTGQGGVVVFHAEELDIMNADGEAERTVRPVYLPVHLPNREAAVGLIQMLCRAFEIHLDMRATPPPDQNGGRGQVNKLIVPGWRRERGTPKPPKGEGREG